MIGFLPQIYDDELVYSWISRYYCHSGYDAYNSVIEDFYGKRSAHPDVLYPTRMCVDAKEVVTRMLSLEDLYVHHTMLPLIRFVDPERLRGILQQITEQTDSIRAHLPLPKESIVKTLRFCPLCVKEDRALYGETYWHRSAQLPDIGICVKHRCKLCQSKVPVAGKKSPRLYIAEEEIGDIDPVHCPELAPEGGNELQLAQYYTEVFQGPIDLNNRNMISPFLKSRLEGTSYLSDSGRVIWIGKLYQDLVEFYSRNKYLTVPSQSQILKCFTGKNWQFTDVCMIGLFLGISPSELISPSVPTELLQERFVCEVKRLTSGGMGYRRIAKVLHVDPGVVRKARRTHERSVQVQSGRKGINEVKWSQLDREMLPKVIEACTRLYGGDRVRPHKVRITTIERMLALPPKKILSFQLCREHIAKYYETQEEYWAREVIWAYRQLRTEGKGPITMRKIRDLTNMRKADFDACKDHLPQHGTSEEVEALMAVL